MQTTQESKSNSKKTGQNKKSTSSELLEIDREFNVPIETLFNAFTTIEALKVWWWPKGLYADQIEMDFKEGGRYFINMKGFDRGGGGMTGEFQEIVQNSRIVMTDYFADENGLKITAEEAKMPGQWPETVYITLEFESLGPEKSRLHLAQEGIPKEMRKDCIKGWSESFDKLEEYLE